MYLSLGFYTLYYRRLEFYCANKDFQRLYMQARNYAKQFILSRRRWRRSRGARQPNSPNANPKRSNCQSKTMWQGRMTTVAFGG